MQMGEKVSPPRPPAPPPTTAEYHPPHYHTTTAGCSPVSNPAAWTQGKEEDYTPASSSSRAQGTAQGLADALRRIDGKGYKAYRDIEGSWACTSPAGAYTLHVDRVQGDPYASPSRCSVTLPSSTAGLPAALLSSRIRRTAVCDFLTRSFGAAVAAAGGDIRRQSGGWSGEKGGEMSVDRAGQHVLERTSVMVQVGGLGRQGHDMRLLRMGTWRVGRWASCGCGRGWHGGGVRCGVLAPAQAGGTLEARFTVALPARGRSVLGQWAATILLQVGGLSRGASMQSAIFLGCQHASLA